MKLMIVDDHAEVRGLIRELIGHFADEILECASGEEAMAGCVHFRPDFVTMDIHMRGTDGFEATRRIMSALPTTCVAIITQSNSAEALAAANRAGASYFIPKENLAVLPQFLRLLQHRFNLTPA